MPRALGALRSAGVACRRLRQLLYSALGRQAVPREVRQMVFREAGAAEQGLRGVQQVWRRDDLRVPSRAGHTPADIHTCRNLTHAAWRVHAVHGAWLRHLVGDTCGGRFLAGPLGRRHIVSRTADAREGAFVAPSSDGHRRGCGARRAVCDRVEAGHGEAACF